MMEYSEEQSKITDLIKEAITVLCKSGLTYNVGFALEGEIKIMLDTKKMFRISLNEVFGLTIEDLIILKKELHNIQVDKIRGKEQYVKQKKNEEPRKLADKFEDEDGNQAKRWPVEDYETHYLHKGGPIMPQNEAEFQNIMQEMQSRKRVLKTQKQRIEWAIEQKEEEECIANLQSENEQLLLKLNKKISNSDREIKRRQLGNSSLEYGKNAFKVRS